MSKLDKADVLLSEGLDAIWLIITACGLLLTQVGFACLEGAAARRKDEKTVLFKNMLDHSVASLAWYFSGYRILTAKGWFSSQDVNISYARILQQFGFEITTSSIVSACVLGRCRLDTYIIFSGLLAGFTYPILAFACWNPNGPLTMFGYKDFGGGGVVHFFAGCTGFVASRLCGKRVGTTSTGTNVPAMSAIGGLVLYIAWFFVNAGSSGAISNESAIRSASRAALNTALSAGAASIMSYLICKYVKRRLDLDFLVNSLLGGLIAITGPCGFVHPHAAVVVGLLAPWTVMESSRMFKNVFDLDDPLEALSVHGACGCLGIVATGLFHTGEGLMYTLSPSLITAQVTGLVVIACWALCTALPFFSIARWLNALSYTENEQMTGLDNIYFGDYMHGKSNEDLHQNMKVFQQVGGEKLESAVL